MLKTVKDIAERLVECYELGRKTIYGSCGTKKERKNSDIDLNVVTLIKAFKGIKRKRSERLQIGCGR